MSDSAPNERIEHTRYDSPEGAVLVLRAVEDLNSRYETHEHNPGTLDASKFLPPAGTFLVAYVDNRPAGCGALRPLEDGVAEVKRMYVEPRARRNGIGRRILSELEATAKRHGYRAVRLETGTRQPEAIRLYESAGYRPIAKYGEFADNPLSICYEKRMTNKASD
ncbi:MAG TPA: GNAT family N-acetyltransferase [Gemmataceae bacterium]